VWGWGGAAPLSCRRNLTPARDEAAGGCGPRTGGSDEDGGAAFAKCSRSDYNCSGQEGATLPPPPPRLLPGDEWLPPLPFRPLETPPRPDRTWAPWTAAQGTPHRPRYSWRAGPGPGSLDPQVVINEMAAALAADRVYDSLDELAAAFHAQLSTLTCLPAFQTWQRGNPAFKPRLSGFLATPRGPRRITVLLDTGATHCFICARLVATLGLLPSDQPGPSSVMTAGSSLELAAPVLIHLCLGDAFRESMSVSPMDMDVGDDLILG